MTASSPTADQAIFMLTTLFARAGEGEFIDLRLIRRDGRSKEEFFPGADPSAAADWAIDRREKGDVYVGVLPRSDRRGGRDAVGTARVVWVDCDSPESVAALAAFPLAPSMMVKSGSGENTHAYWFLADSIALDRVEEINRRLAATLGADTCVADAARVLRVPGTLNHKHDPSTKVRLETITEVTYSVEVLEAELPGVETAAEVAERPRRTGARAVGVEASGPTERVLTLLDEVTETGNGWKARCPAHDDQNPSLSIAAAEDGRCLLHCFASCAVEDITQAMGLGVGDLFDASGGDGEGSRSTAEILVGIAEQAGVELFHDSAETAYARVPVDGHHEVWTVGSRKFKRWLRLQLREVEGRMAKTEALNEAIELLSAQADFDGPEVEVALRSAWVPGGFAYNLADEEGHVVTVTAEGWSVGVDSEARFVRRSSVQALPVPVAGGSTELLRRYVNVESEEDFMLTVAWLLMALRPTGPFPALVVQGQQGSAKSTLSRVLKALVDPVKAPVRSLPSGLRDLAIMADANWVVVMDNLSVVKDTMSDALCRLATGGGFATRALWTDDEERIFEQMRAVVLNGIDAVVTRQDLLGRSIVLRLPKIQRDARRDEETFWKEFDNDRPKILGALLDGASVALASWETTHVEGLRMADFARWAVAGAPVFGWTQEALLDAYEENLSGALKASLEGSVLAAVVMRLAEGHALPIEDTPTAVRKLLKGSLTDEEAKEREFPANAQAMSVQLSRLAPALAEVGIEVVVTKRGSGRSRSRSISLRAMRADQEDVNAGDAGDAS